MYEGDQKILLPSQVRMDQGIMVTKKEHSLSRFTWISQRFRSKISKPYLQRNVEHFCGNTYFL